MKLLICKESKQPKIKVKCSDTIVIHLVQLTCQIIGFVEELYCLVKFYHATPLSRLTCTADVPEMLPINVGV